MTARLAVGSSVPHFVVSTAGGREVRYRDVWQRRTLVLVRLPPDDQEAAAEYERALRSPPDLLAPYAAILVVTRDPIPGLSAPAFLVADRWGEIQHVAHDLQALPDRTELADWLQYVEQQCPECQGEVK